MSAPLPDNEQERLAALERYEILDTEPEPSFDRITAIAARMLGVPIALITLIDAERQWIKSRVGFELRQTPRSSALCAHTIAQDDLLVVPDAHADRRFAEHAWVLSKPKLRFYAGAPLQTHDGYNLGTLCVIDERPRQLTPEQHAGLRDLAALVVDELELRFALRANSMAKLALNVAQLQLRDHVRQLRAIVESTAEGIVVVDRHARPTLVNPSARSMFGLDGANEPDDWQRVSQLRKPDGVTPLSHDEQPITRALQGLATDYAEVAAPAAPGGGPRWLSVSGRPLRDEESGHVTGGVVTFSDIGALRAAREHVAELALTDELTGLPNRRAFTSALSRLIAESGRGREFALVMLDIDHFKRINDDYGHPLGDQVLVAVARCLTGRVRSVDLVARYGGEEFCILYVDVALERALSLADEQRRKLEALTQPHRVTASFGVSASYAEQRPSADVLIARADAALYRAKREGRNRVCAEP